MNFEGFGFDWIVRDAGRVAVGADEVVRYLDGNPRHVSRYIKDVYIDYRFQFSDGKTGRPRWYVYEPGVYQLIFSSSLATIAPEKAEKFQRWIFEEVLPKLRCEGAYISPDIKPEQKERVLARLLEMPRAPHPLFGSENMDRVAAFLKCSRNSPKLANWMWQFVYEDLNAKERAYLNKHNPVKSNGHRQYAIHAWLEENTMHEHKAHFDAILLLIELSQTEAEFMELYQRKFKRAFQINLF